MNKEETLALYAQGHGFWNVWAEQMLASKAELEANGHWSVQVDVDDGKIEGRNTETKNWIMAAAADFSEHPFGSDTTLNGFCFPGYANLARTSFMGSANFQQTEFHGPASFHEARFHGGASFTRLNFEQEIDFNKTEFHGPACFTETTFREGAIFTNVRFDGLSDFEEAHFFKFILFDSSIFKESASFNGATFDSDAGFPEIEFRAGAVFIGATFKSSATFSGTIFKQYASFNHVEFRGLTDFGHATSEKFVHFEEAVFQRVSFKAIDVRSFFGLSYATFYKVPDFSQAHFSEAPMLDYSKFLAAPTAPSRDEPARWRALKRLAVQAHDHEREQMFFAEEVKSLRGVEHYRWPKPFNKSKDQGFWPGGGRYWLGMFYEIFSNFGRSIFRPFIALITLIIVSASFYYCSQAPADPRPPSTLVEHCDSLEAAVYVSIHNALIFAGQIRSTKLEQSYNCLYPESGSISGVPTDIVYFGIVETIASAVLIFLLLLAVRNQFRIK